MVPVPGPAPVAALSSIICSCTKRLYVLCVFSQPMGVESL